MKRWLQQLEIGIEELILVFLIVIEALDFFTIIPAPLEYAEKVIAIIAMCYLFYKASITKIVFGKRERMFDAAIILGYMLLTLKTITGFVISAAEEQSVMSGFYGAVLSNIGVIEKTGFLAGGMLLIFVSILLVREKVKKPCIMAIIHEDKAAKDVGHKVLRFLSSYLVLLAIFVVLFTFAIEWLAITVDAPVLMIFLFFYLFVIVKRGKGMKTESFLKKVGESSEGFYEHFISFFHSRKTITKAITGLLVLHLLVEIGHFIIPYTTGLLYPWYFAQLGAGHVPLHVQMVQDFASAGTVWLKTGTILIYILNLIAILMLFFGPAYAWIQTYQKKKTKLPNVAWIFFGSITVFLLKPVFITDRIKISGLMGTDITTQQIAGITNIWLVILVAILVAGIAHILSIRNFGRVTQVTYAGIFAYFAFYLYHFFISTSLFYIWAVSALAQHKQYFLAAHMLIFFTITIIFYVGGYLMFVHSLFKQKI